MLEGFAQRLVDAQIMTKRAEQLVFQDYGAGTGIGEHVDAPVFGPEVCSISLLSRCVMSFRHTVRKEVFRQILEPRSVIALTSDARAIWSHEIDGRSVTDRRLSITFRTLARHNHPPFKKKYSVIG